MEINVLFLLLAFSSYSLGLNTYLDDPGLCPPEDNGVSCDKSIEIPCDMANPSGSIFSPGYRSPSQSSDRLNRGKYKLRFVSLCPSAVFQITVSDDSVTLPNPLDVLKMGDGSQIGLQGFLSVEGNENGNELGGVPQVEIITAASQFWMDLLITSSRGISFSISYTVLLFESNETTFTSSTGNITSPGFFAGESYSAFAEQISIIDIPDYDSEQYDLNITVHSLDIAGGYGDFLAIGTGPKPFADPEAVLLSWKLESPRHLILPGTKAYVVFYSFLKTVPIASRGYWLSYQVRDASNLTTPAPQTTTTPTTPAPSYAEMETTVVVFDHSLEEWSGTNSEVVKQFRRNITDICNCYDSSVNTVEADVLILYIKSCYEGWWLGSRSCTEVETAVISEKSDGKPAFPRSRLQAALQDPKCGADQKGIVLPSDLSDVYFYAILAAVAVILLVALLLVGIWRAKLRDFYRQQQELFMIQSAKMEDELNRRNSSIAPVGGLNPHTKPWKRGVDNPNFVLDEDSGEAALEYDPETGAALPASSIYSWMRQPSKTNTFRSGLWDDGADSESEIYSQAAAPSVVSNTLSSASKSGSTTASVQKRSILKKTNSNGLPYDMVPAQSERSTRFEDVPLNGVATPHIYEVPTSVQLLDDDDNSSIGETQL